MADVQHSALTSVHRFAHVSSSDPGAVGAFHGWVDTSTSPFTLKVRNSLNTGWASVGAVNLDDLGDVIITSPSTGQVLKFNGTSWVNDTDATGGGGGGSGLYSPDKPYGSPDTLDDEFDAGSLDAKWTRVNTGSTMHSSFDIDNHVGLYCIETNFNGIGQVTTNVDQTVRAKIRPHPKDANTGVIGLFIKSTSNDIAEVVFQNATRILYRSSYASPSSGGSFTAMINPLFTNAWDVREFYLELKYVASSKVVTFRISWDGVTFYDISGHSLTLGANANAIGISVHGDTTSPAQIDWFRKLQGNYTGGNA